MADVTEGVPRTYAPGHIYDQRKPPSKRAQKRFSLEDQEETSPDQSKKPPKDERMIHTPEDSDTDAGSERAHPEKELGQFVDLTG